MFVIAYLNETVLLSIWKKNLNSFLYENNFQIIFFLIDYISLQILLIYLEIFNFEGLNFVF